METSKRELLQKESIESLANELLNAEMSRKPVVPITERYPEVTIEDAYHIQLKVVEAKRKLGQTVVGKKIGLTSKQMQQLLGVYEPDYGHIMDSLMVFEGDSIDLNLLIQPKLEAEIAFFLQEDLTGPGVTVAKVLKATRGITAAIEVIDSRIEKWRIKIQDTVADNASIGRVVLGGRMSSVEDVDLRLLGMVLRKNGEIVSCSSSAAVLGNPAQAVAWLANKLSTYGINLKAGELIMSGSLVAAVEVGKGDEATVEFDRLGSVSVRFK